MHSDHRNMGHISLGFMLFSIVILGAILVSSVVSAAVEPIQPKDVNTLSADEIEAEKTTIETKKTSLESQSVTEQENLIANRNRQIEIYGRMDTLKDLLSNWKKVEKLYKKLEKTNESLEKLDVAIAVSSKASDTSKKTKLEKTKTAIISNINGFLAKIKELDTTLDLTLDTLTTDRIVEEKAQATAAMEVAKSDLKAAKLEKKAILTEKTNIRKIVTTTTTYLKKLTAKLLFLQDNPTTPETTPTTPITIPTTTTTTTPITDGNGNTAVNGYLTTSRTVASASANGDGTIANLISGGSGYMDSPPIKVTGTGKCSVFPTATAQVEYGIIQSISLTGGTCTQAPTITIPAPNTLAQAVVNENAARTVTITDPGFGYVAPPLVSVTGGVCITHPTAIATVEKGKLINIELIGANCTTKPILTITYPNIPATATITGSKPITTDLFFQLTATMTKKGAGYMTPPHVKVVGGTCAVYPRARAILEGDRVDLIALSGAVGCSVAPTGLVIDGPDKLGVPTEVPAESITGDNYFVNRVAATATFARNTTTGDITATITKKGSGYLFPPKITGTLANPLACSGGLTATTKIKNGILESITFTGQCSTLPTFVLPPPTSKATTTLQFNGETLTVTMTNPGTGYSTAQPPTVTMTNCPNITPTAIISQTGTITGLQFSGTGPCTGIPTFTIGAPTTGTRATAAFAGAGLLANITNSGSGYVAPPTITISGGTCTGTAPSATTSLTEGRVTGVTVLGNCKTIPTVTFEEPIIPATATTTKTGEDTFQVNYTKRGAGYVVPPRIAVSGTCKLLPYAKSTIEEGRIKDIIFIGARGCSTALTLVIDPPNQIGVPLNVEKTLSGESAKIFNPSLIANPSSFATPILGTGTINFNGSNTTTTSAGTTVPPVSDDPYCLGTRPGDSSVLVPGSAVGTPRQWSHESIFATGPFQNCTFRCTNGYNSSTQRCN